MRILKAPTFWISTATLIFVGIAFAIMLVARQHEAQTDIENFVGQWEYDLGKNLKSNSESKEIIGKVASTLMMYPINQYRVFNRNNQIVEFPKDARANGLPCDIPVQTPLSVNEIPIGRIEACLSQQKLVQATLLSPFFSLIAVLGFAVIVISGFLPLFGYKRALKNTVAALKEWNTNSSNSIRTDGLDKLSAEVVNLIRDGNESRLQLAKVKSQLDISNEIAKMARRFAHDIDSPASTLASIAASIEGVEPDKQAVIDSLVQRIQSIGEKLLNSSKAKAREGLMAPVELAPLVEEVLAEKRISAPQIAFEFRPFQIAFAKCSPDELKSILSNVLNNSIEAMGLRGKIVCTVAKIDGYASITVEDNGKGIPQDVLPHVFEQDFTYGKKDGNGIGLFFAKTQITAWGGQVNIESKPNSGTTVRIYLMDGIRRTESSERSIEV